MPAFPYKGLGITHVGKVRPHNEDSFLVDNDLGLFVVCDGVGGEAAGEVASAHSCTATQRIIRKHHAVLQEYAKNPNLTNRAKAIDVVTQAVEVAGREVFRMGVSNPSLRGMASTLVMLVMAGQNAIVAHLGDSRLYVRRQGETHQLTLDHSALRARVRLGFITEEEAAKQDRDGKLVRAIGLAEFIQVESLHLELMPGDTFLICSDGLHRYFRQDEFGQLCEQLPLEQLPGKLIDLANAAGGRDNITAVLVRVEPLPQAGGDADVTVARKVEVLRRIPLFRELDYQEVMKVLSAVTVRTCRQGEQIITDGEPGKELYVSLAGKMGVVKNNTTLAELAPGTVFGEMSLIDNAPRSADVFALDPAKLMVIRRSDFDVLLEKEPALGVKLLRTFCNELTQRLRQSNEQRSSAPGKPAPPPDVTVSALDALVQATQDKPPAP